MSTEQKLLSILRVEGPMSPATLMSRLNLSQPTLFRAVQSHSETILALGARRNRRLAALRNIRNRGSVFPILVVSPEGDLQSLGTLIALYPTSFAFLPDATPTQPLFYSSLPFFLDDLRPQGFLGRAFAQNHTDLMLPPRILDWGSDDILECIALRGEDLPGNLLVGAESFIRFQSHHPHEVIQGDAPEKQYSLAAQNALNGEPAGSSVGGEQPKFSATLKFGNDLFKKVIVKFSPSGNTFAATRWSDLLICESLALEILQESGIEAAKNRILSDQDRTFLEVTRFDRIGLKGRRGAISLSALENEWVGRGKNWSDSALVLERLKKISQEDLQTIQKLESFGRLIANTDRHSGNLSFFWQPDSSTAKLCPVYDMLPMLYAPSSGGENLNRVFTLPAYEYSLRSVWKEMLQLAIQYWARVQEDPRISEGFKNIARENLKTLK